MAEMVRIGCPPHTELVRGRRARRGGITLSVWETLSEPWRACVELAWEANRVGSLPIGAVVTDAGGSILAAGRNRIHERSGPLGAVFGSKLAHAELNALLRLEGEEDPRACILFTTTEPCPLCVGAARMADVGRLRYASREPWAGSAAMFETVPYLRRGGLGVVGAEDPRLEAVLVALQLERFLRLKPEALAPLLGLYEEVMPKATRIARDAHGSGLLRAMSADGASAREMVRALDEGTDFPA